MRSLFFWCLFSALVSQDLHAQADGIGRAGGTGNQLFPTNAQTATYQTIPSDWQFCKTIPVSSGTFTITVVASATQPKNGACLTVLNYGSGVVTVAPSGQNINGSASSQTIAAGSASSPKGLWIVSDGTNYEAQPLGAAASGSVAFSAITSGTNTAAAMVVGTGASLNPSGSGVINANEGNGAAFPVSALFVNTNASAQFGALTAAQATAALNVFSSTLQGLVPASGGGTTVFLNANGAFTVPPGTGCAPGGSSTDVLTDNGSGGCNSNTNAQISSGGILTKYDGLSTVGLGVEPILYQSVLSNSSATSLVTLATAPAAGDYIFHYDLDLHTACSAGTTGILELLISWTGNSARTETTGGWMLNTSQTATDFYSGELHIHVVSGNVTFTPTLAPACGAGTATWDGDIYLTRAN